MDTVRRVPRNKYIHELLLGLDTDTDNEELLWLGCGGTPGALRLNDIGHRTESLIGIMKGEGKPPKYQNKVMPFEASISISDR
jgi:hypothetical protein